MLEQFWQNYPANFTHFKSPIVQWHEIPTFLVGEYLFYCLTIIALIHAIRSTRLHILIWVASLLSGTANDVFFMFLPVVDNFWQAQATIMITPRLPLYIPCVYICFMYYSVIAAWNLSAKPIATAALAGILALLFYGPYDILGAKFLWWTWHMTDASVHERLLGVPVGSSMWILTFVFSFSLLLQYSTKKDPNIGLKKSLGCLAVCCLFTTPLMILQMTLLDLFEKNNAPSIKTFLANLALYILLFFISFFYRGKQKNPVHSISNKSNKMLSYAIFFYYLMLLLLIFTGKPEKHVSIGVHQTYGPCDAIGTDITGHTRKLYVCENDNNDFFIVCDPLPPKAYENWYRICGKPYQNKTLWVGGMLFYCILGFFSYTYLFKGRYVTT